MKQQIQFFIILLTFLIVGNRANAQTSTSLIWSYSTDWYVWSVVPTNDVNGNGKNDVFAGAWDDRIYCLEGASGA